MNTKPLTSSSTLADARKILQAATSVEQLDQLLDYVTRFNIEFALNLSTIKLIEERNKLAVILSGVEVDLDVYRWITAAASDDESRPTLTFVHADDCTRLVTTDGYRLHVLDGAAGQELAAKLGDGTFKHAKVGKRQAIGIEQDVRYPSWEAIVPERCTMTRSEFPVDEVVHAVKKLSRKADGLSKGAIGISMLGHIVPARADSDGPVFSTLYMLDTLNTKGADTVTIYVSGPERPILIDLCKGHDHFGTAVIMPVFKKNLHIPEDEVGESATELAAILG